MPGGTISLITRAAVVGLALVACGGGGADAGDPASSDPCRARPGAAVLCLTFSPEAVAPESEPGLDARGFLRVDVFDSASPPAGAAASRGLLEQQTFPEDFEHGGEISLAELPNVTVVLADPPAVVYVQSLFFDNGTQFNWGTWFGGMDLGSGLEEQAVLEPVSLARDRVTEHDLPLAALRRLTATVTTSATPLGDGEGALSVFASRVEQLPPAAPTFGYGIDPCVDVTRGAQTVEMFLVGSGTFFVAASFEDLGIETPGGMPPGTMLSVRDVDLDTGTGRFDAVTLEPRQYTAKIGLDLGFVSPFDGDPDLLGPNSCVDLGLPGPP
jgi:hypothetical protein